MRDGAILSGLLHGIVILLLLIGLPDVFRRNLEPPPVIPIEIINIADLTQAPAPKVKPKDDSPKEEPKEKPKPPKPTPVAEKTPELEKETDPKAEPELTMDDLLAPLDEEKQKEEKPKKKPEKKQKEKPKKKKVKAKPKNDFMSLLNNIEKTEASSKGKAQPQPDQDETSTADHAANNISEVLSITELDLVRRQLAACWNVPAGARDAHNLYVDVKVEMNPDATVRSAVVVGSSGGNNPFSRAASDSALRAVRNPQCNPLKLPLDRYDQWKTITIRFDPQHVL